jgi:hypothetical protein
MTALDVTGMGTGCTFAGMYALLFWEGCLLASARVLMPGGWLATM